MSSKLKLRIGDVEIEYEGTEDFLKEELPKLLKTAMDLHRTTAVPEPDAGHGGGASGGHKTPTHKGKVPTLTTGSIADKLKASSGPELLLAAAAHLILVKQIDPVSRKQLIAEMKTATSYYNKSMASNLTKILKSAGKDGHLTEISSDNYSLSAATSAELVKKLANA